MTESLQPLIIVQPLMVTIEQAAQMLGYRRDQIYTMLRRGEIQSVGEGRARRIPVAELQRWVQAQMRPYETSVE